MSRPDRAINACARGMNRWPENERAPLQEVAVGTKKADARKTRVRRSHCDFSASADLIHCPSPPSRYVYSGKKKGMTKRETIIIITWSGTPTRI